MISRKSEDVDRVVDNSHNTNDFEREKNESMLYYEFLSRQYEEENRKNEEKVT
jgi:hypothetical protein